MSRAAKLKIYVQNEEKKGHNAMTRAAKSGTEAPWLVKMQNANEHQHTLDHYKKVAGTAAKCAVITTYVDDCDLDAAKPLRSLMWKVIRVFFESSDPAETQKFLGIVKVVPELGPGEVDAGGLSQADYIQILVEETIPQ